MAYKFRIGEDKFDSATLTMTNATSVAYKDGSVAGADIADDAVTSAKIADGAVVSGSIADGNVVAAKLADDAVATAKIADNAVTLAKMAGITRASIIIGDTNGNPAELAKGNANTVLKSDGTDISYGAVTTAMIANDAITSDKIADDAVGGAHLAANAVVFASVSGSAISSDIAGDASSSKLARADAVKSYVDSVAQGLDLKESVVLATVSNLTGYTYNNGAGTLTAGANAAFQLDGVAASINDRILVKNQTAGAQNGIYTVSTVGNGSTPAVLTRATDFASAGQMDKGSFCFVEKGDTFADCGFVMTQDTAITVGTTAITWSQFSSAGLSIGGDGITKNGNTFDLDAALTTVTSIKNNGLVLGVSDDHERIEFNQSNQNIKFYAGASGGNAIEQGNFGEEGLLIEKGLRVQGVFRNKVQQLNSNQSPSDFAAGSIIIYDVSGGNRTFTLPEASNSLDGAIIKIKRLAGSNTLTIQRTNNDLIDGEASIVLRSPYSGITLLCDNSGNGFWHIL